MARSYVRKISAYKHHTLLGALHMFQEYYTFVYVVREMFDYDKMLQLIVAGFFVCLDSFLSLLTIMPARIVVTLWRLLKTRWVCILL
jgi:hypothetical protein